MRGILMYRQQHRRQAVLAVGVGAAAQQVVHRLHTVFDVHDGIGKARVAQRIDRHFGIGGAVFSKQDAADGGHAVNSLVGASSAVG